MCFHFLNNIIILYTIASYRQRDICEEIEIQRLATFQQRNYNSWCVFFFLYSIYNVLMNRDCNRRFK